MESLLLFAARAVLGLFLSSVFGVMLYLVMVPAVESIWKVGYINFALMGVVGVEQTVGDAEIQTLLLGCRLGRSFESFRQFRAELDGLKDHSQATSCRENPFAVLLFEPPLRTWVGCD